MRPEDEPVVILSEAKNLIPDMIPAGDGYGFVIY